MQDLAKLLEAVASLLWPLLAGFIIYYFRAEIRDLLRRLRKGKFFGQEVELEDSLVGLEKAAEKLSIESHSSKTLAIKDDDSTDVIEEILREAQTSPKLALMHLTAEIEKSARVYLSIMGHLDSSQRPSLPDSFKRLQGWLPGYIPSTVSYFLDVRNKLVHSFNASDDDLLRAIDSGLTILRALHAIPHETNIVLHPGVDVYGDAEGRSLMPDVKGVVLETTTPSGVGVTRRVFPTTRKHFVKGKKVGWEWNMNRKWDAAWYKDLETGEMKEAWGASLEFIGPNLDDLTMTLVINDDR